MLPPGYVEIRAQTLWQGETITAAQVLPAEAWGDGKMREEVQRRLSLSIAEAIAERLDVAYVVAHTESRGGALS